jgi:hypothetical protein
MPNQSYTFPTDSSGKAGAVVSVNGGNDFYVPVAGTMTTPTTVLNAMTANSTFTQTTAVTTTTPTAGNQADMLVKGYGLTTLQVYSTVNNTAPTSAPTLSTATTGGTMTAGTYYVKFTWVSTSGVESLPSPEVSQATTGSTSTLTVTIPSLPTGMASANIYISTATGTETKQNASPVTATTYTQTSAISAGTACPSTNPTATLNFYGSADGVNFIPVNATSRSTSTTGIIATNLTDIYSIDTRGLQYVRVLVGNYAIVTPSGTSISATGVSEGYAGSNDTTTLTGTTVMQPVDLQGIYYKSASGYDALPVYSPDGIAIGVATAFTQQGIPVADFPMLWNSGTSYDRMTNNINVNIQNAGTAKTATFTTSDQTNYNAKGVYIFVNVTVVSGTTPTMQPIVQIKDAGVSNVVFPILTASTNITATGMYVYAVYPTAISGTTQSVNTPLSRTWNVQFVIGGTTPSFTFSIGASYIL